PGDHGFPRDPQHGEPRLVHRPELESEQSRESSAESTPGARSGWSSACWMGNVIDGGQSCASIAPSVNSTRQCTMLCGCSTAVHCAGLRPKSHCASISSRPLLARVAESTVIF